MTDYTAGGFSDDDRVSDWELGLPNAGDLTPLSQSLIPPELASAFSITPEPYRTNLDVNRASQKTMSSLRGQYQNSDTYTSGNNFKSFDDLDGADPIGDGTDPRKSRRVDGESATKRARLVWTPQLHKRFVDVVAHVGIKNAVPKTIMQMMNVEGLTRENVASHLQKYRLYLKRMQGLSNEGPSASDHLFASTPVPPSLRSESTGGKNNCNGNGGSAPMAYGAQMVPVYGHMGMSQGGMYPGYEYSNNSMIQQRDWSGNKFG